MRVGWTHKSFETSRARFWNTATCDRHACGIETKIVISRPVPLTSEYETSTLRRWFMLRECRASKEEATLCFLFSSDRMYIHRCGQGPQEREWLRWLWRDLDLHMIIVCPSRRCSVLPKERAGPNGKPPGTDTVELIRTTEPFRRPFRVDQPLAKKSELFAPELAIEWGKMISEESYSIPYVIWS